MDKLNELMIQIAMFHPADKADLFIEFLRKKNEIEQKLTDLNQFIDKNFKEDIDGRTYIRL